MCSIQRSRLPGAVHIFSHFLRSLLMDSPGEFLEENRKRFLCLPLVSQTSVDPRKHSVCAARDSGHFPHRRQRGLAIVLFPERPAHLPVEPVRVERIDALGLLDPIDRFVGAANIEQRIRTADEDIPNCWDSGRSPDRTVQGPARSLRLRYGCGRGHNAPRHRPERAGWPCRRIRRRASTPRHGYVPARATRMPRHCDRTGPARYSRTGSSDPLRSP